MTTEPERRPSPLLRPTRQPKYSSVSIACEARSCSRSNIRAENWNATIETLQSLGWYAQERDGAFRIFCPRHNPAK